MNIRYIMHKNEDGSLWAEVPSLPGCYTMGENITELYENLIEVVNGYVINGHDNSGMVERSTLNLETIQFVPMEA